MKYATKRKIGIHLAGSALFFVAQLILRWAVGLSFGEAFGLTMAVIVVIAACDLADAEELKS